jgi:transcriptional regulator with XRE-family HTH domain
VNNSNQLLDMYSQRLSLKTNQAIADKLGVQRPTVSMWRNGASHPNAAAIAAMCKATDESLAKWLPLIEAERCRTDADKKVWLRLAQTAACIALALGVTAAPSKSYAATSSIGDYTCKSSPVYIMRN